MVELNRIYNMEKQNTYNVYKHILPNGKVYIGITKNIKSRFYGKGSSYKNCVLFYRAINKYGWDNIKTEILLSNLTQCQAEEKEIEYISKYKSNDSKFGYNILKGGNISTNDSQERRKKISKSLIEYYKTNKHSQESIERARQKKIGVKFSSEHKQKLKDNHSGMTGKVFSEEHKRKISNSLKGKKFSEEHKRKPSKAKEGKTPWNAINNTKKPVMQFDKNGAIINTFTSMSEAERKTGIFNSSISNCCKGKRKTAGGYIWKYAETSSL